MALVVPENHTYYLTTLYLSSTNSQANIVKAYYLPRGGSIEYIDRIVFDKEVSRTFGSVYPLKLNTGDAYGLRIQGVAGNSGTSTANLHYIDLPWVD